VQGFNIDIVCCRFYHAGEPEKCGDTSGSYVKRDGEWGGPAKEPARFSCGNFESVRTESDFIIATAPAWGCGGLGQAYAYRSEEMGNFEAAVGVQRYDSPIFGYPIGACSCAYDHLDTYDNCSWLAAQRENFSWAYTYTIYEIIDSDRFWFQERSDYRCWNCEDMDTEKTDLYLTSTSHTVSAQDEYNGLYPAWVLPAGDAKYSWILQKLSKVDPRYKSYSNQVESSDDVYYYKCDRSLDCYWYDPDGFGSEKWSLMIGKNGAGFLLYRDIDSDSILGTWLIKMYPHMEYSGKDTEPPEALPSEPADDIRMVTFFEDNEMLQVDIENIPYVRHQHFTMAIQD
jgi:hypothetical protein